MNNPNSNEFITTRGYAVGLSAAMHVLETSPASRARVAGSSRSTNGAWVARPAVEVVRFGDDACR
jgi:hypothetical protein